MLKRTEEVRQELCKKKHWEKSYERLQAKNYEPRVYEEMFIIMEIERDDIIDALMDGSYDWSTPRRVELAKAGTDKKRLVYLYSQRDRYILGVLYRAISVVYKDKVAPNCYSYQEGVNTGDALKEISNSKFKEKYSVKVDIKAYFNSISREALEHDINDLFEGGLKETISKLYLNDRVDVRGKVVEEYKGMIPGCAMGSFFANYSLKDMDQHFLDEGKVYARYSDDIILFGESEEEITEGIGYIKVMLKEKGLKINETKYEYYSPGEPIVYLGLELSEGGIDISPHAKNKKKRQIKRWVKKARREIEMDHAGFEEVAKKLVKRYNYGVYKCYLEDASKFGWGYYVFRYITKTESLTEIDFYLRDQLGYLKTGKHNKGNVGKISEEEFRQLGVVSSYEMYELFKRDFELYKDIVSTMP